MRRPASAASSKTMGEAYDGIIIGGGHNALVLQAYLTRAGLDVLLVEQRAVVGGGLATLEDPAHPGFLHNTHAFFQRAITAMPWFQDLDLERHGAAYIEPDLNVALLLSDGRVLEWWTDFEKTARSFARFNRRDAATLRRWRDEFIPIVDQILRPEALSPPLPPEERRSKLARSPMGRRLLEVAEMSPIEFVHREFEDPAIKAGLLFFNGLREVDLRAKGFGHHIAALLASPVKAQMSRGGSAALARALELSVRQSGGKIRTLVRPARIAVAHGRACGVVTSEGELIKAKNFVVSSLNPHQTFLELLDRRHVPAAVRIQVSDFRYNLLAPLFSLNLNLRSAPRYKAEADYPELNRAFMVIMGLDHVDQFPQIVRHHERGTIPRTVMWGACPTIFDPTQAPPGHHTGFMWEKLPYRLNGDARNWDAEREKHGRVMLRLWAKHAPNIEEAVISSFTRSALDVERCLPNMREGDLLVGAFTNGQIGYNRPFAGAGRYRTHLPGLYLCGSSSHPGGNITGLPGYNAAQVMLADFGLPPLRPGARPRVRRGRLPSDS
jgi:phytoene dehydrogenase-like protein